MENYPAYPRQENYLSDEVNSRIVQGNNFSGTVLESVGLGQDAPVAPNIGRGGGWHVSQDMVDSSRSGVFQGGYAPVPRPRVLLYGTPEITSPMESKYASLTILLSTNHRMIWCIQMVAQ